MAEPDTFYVKIDDDIVFIEVPSKYTGFTRPCRALALRRPHVKRGDTFLQCREQQQSARCLYAGHHKPYRRPDAGQVS